MTRNPELVWYLVPYTGKCTSGPRLFKFSKNALNTDRFKLFSEHSLLKFWLQIWKNLNAVPVRQNQSEYGSGHRGQLHSYPYGSDLKTLVLLQLPEKDMMNCLAG
jgi:hypothetical protein